MPSYATSAGNVFNSQQLESQSQSQQAPADVSDSGVVSNVILISKRDVTSTTNIITSDCHLFGAKVKIA